MEAMLFRYVANRPNHGSGSTVSKNITISDSWVSSRKTSIQRARKDNVMSDKSSSREELPNVRFPKQWLLDRLFGGPDMQSDSERECLLIGRAQVDGL